MTYLSWLPRLWRENVIPNEVRNLCVALFASADVEISPPLQEAQDRRNDTFPFYSAEPLSFVGGGNLRLGWGARALAAPTSAGVTKSSSPSAKALIHARSNVPKVQPRLMALSSAFSLRSISIRVRTVASFLGTALRDCCLLILKRVYHRSDIGLYVAQVAKLAQTAQRDV